MVLVVIIHFHGFTLIISQIIYKRIVQKIRSKSNQTNEKKKNEHTYETTTSCILETSLTAESHKNVGSLSVAFISSNDVTLSQPLLQSFPLPLHRGCSPFFPFLPSTRPLLFTHIQWIGLLWAVPIETDTWSHWLDTSFCLQHEFLASGFLWWPFWKRKKEKNWEFFQNNYSPWPTDLSIKIYRKIMNLQQILWKVKCNPTLYMSCDSN